MRMNGLSTCGSPSLVTFRPSGGSVCSSSAGPSSERRLAQLAARARARRDDRYMRILVERQQDALSRDVSWLDDLIQEERTGSAGTPPAGPPANPTGRGLLAGAPGAPVARLVPLASASQLQRAAPRAPGRLPADSD